MTRFQKAVLLAVIILIICGCVCALYFAEPRAVADEVGGNSVRNFVYDFQTLITGIAAVLAAAYTVQQMRFTDERGEARHREMMAFGLRNESRTLMKAFDPYIGELETYHYDLFGWMEEFGAQDKSDFPKWYGPVVHRCSGVIRNAREVFERPQFTQAESLMDGRVINTLRYTKERLDRVLNHMDRYLELVPHGRSSPDAIARWKEYLRTLVVDDDKISDLLLIPHALQEIVDELNRQKLEVLALNQRFGIA